MRLKRVRIFGFKTFADRTEFSLEGGVVAVVGPNGCGKSNLVDAILWGLGEGNARQLRAHTTQDVIFNGSSRRKPVGFAEVSLEFDNEDGSLPIDTPEVTLTRRLTRAGESEYQINRQSCRLRDFHDLLADSGLGRAGYAIVGQKEIDAALSASAEDRRAWIDEAAGVQRYRVRKLESLRRLAGAQDHLSRISDILQELELQREPLREDAERAIQYKSVLATLRSVELGLLAREVAASVRDAAEAESRIAECSKIGLRETQRAERLDRDGQRVSAEIAKIETRMEAVRVLQQTALTAVERSEANIRVLNARLTSLDELETALTQRENDGSPSNRLAEGLAEVALARNEAEAELADFESLKTELAGVGEEASRLSENLKSLDRELKTAREAMAQRQKLIAEIAQRKERQTAATREMKGIDATLPDLQQAVREAEETVAAEQDRLSELRRTIESQDAAYESIKREEEADAQAVRRAMAERASLEGRRSGIEATIHSHEGVSQGSRAVLEARERNLLSAQYTPVAEAIDADAELALAIEIALGASANDLIVDSETDAKEAIAWLKQNRAGRATFQPIPLMRPSDPGPEAMRLLADPGVRGRASDLVTCEPRFRPVIQSLLGRVLIVDSIDDALRLAGQGTGQGAGGWNRMVTLEGEVVHKSGAVTGGQQANAGYAMVQRKADLRSIEKQILKQAKLVSEFDARSEGRRARQTEIRERVDQSRSALAGANQDLIEAQNFHRTLADELKSTERMRERLEQEIAKLGEAGAEHPPQVDVEALELRRDELFGEFASRSADADSAAQRLRESEARVSKAQARLAAAERRHQIAMDSEAQRLKRLESIEPERERVRAAIAAGEQETAAAKISRTEADADLESLTEKRKHLLDERQRLSEEAKDARTNVTAIADSSHQAELLRARAENRRAVALQKLIEDYGMTQEDALAEEQRQRLSSEGGAQSAPPSEEARSAAYAAPPSDGTLSAGGEGRVGWTSGSDPSRATTPPPPDAAALVARLRRELRALGDVNLGAIDAYERLTERLDQLSAQRDDIVSGIEQVNAGISELDKITRERFTTTFAAVQEAFAETFKELFGGDGSGRMTLTDSDRILDTGIELEIQLPGKRRQPLNLLSGGERSLCAAAFLFALLKVKPSPLVVLDEVDAPLDGRNVERFSNMLHAFSAQTQFIVITHNMSTIVSANDWLGVTMQEPGISTLLPVRMPTAEVI